MANKTKKIPTISVVIPAYNEEKLLGKTLKRLQEQTFQDYEIVVSDNNSTDNTILVAKKFGARVVTERQQGYVFALNRGLKEAKGTIVAVTDADTLPRKDWLQAIDKAFQDKSVIGLTGNAQFDIHSPFLRFISEQAYTFFTQCNFWLGKPHTAGFNLAVRRAYIQKIGGADPQYHIGADVHIGLSLKKYGKVVFTKKATVTTSTRRWQKEAMKAFYKYSAAYFYTVWLNRPAPVKLIAIR